MKIDEGNQYVLNNQVIGIWQYKYTCWEDTQLIISMLREALSNWNIFNSPNKMSKESGH